MTFPAILFEDDVILALDKPSGLWVAPGRGEKAAPTLMGMVRERFGPSVANVHRLDADTSGIVLCAKGKPALDFLSGQFQAKTVRKAFVALVAVRPPEPGAPARPGSPRRDALGLLPAEFTVDLALGADAHQPGRMRPLRGREGKPALTEFRVLEAFGRFAWVECRPLTSVAHQVRVHLAAAGAPVLNDAVYGDPGTLLLLSGLKRHYKGRDTEKPLVTRLALHALSLGFLHPAQREPMELTAPVPPDFEIALKYLRRFAGGRAARAI
jgi:23S rRNA pseudouridine1911/1915/1917 synthase